MSVPLTIGQQYRYTTYCQAGDQAGLNVRYLQIVNFTGAATSQDLVNTLDTGASSAYTPLLSVDAEYVGSALQLISGSIPRPIRNISTANTAPGLVAGNMLPTQICGIYTTETGFAGRGFRGRTYVPFVSASSSGPGIIPLPTGPYIAALTTMANDYQGQVTVTYLGGTITFFWALYHKLTGALTKITDAVVRLKFATQRKRGSYGRPNPIGP
jgi:hypothetical protein